MHKDNPSHSSCKRNEFTIFFTMVSNEIKTTYIHVLPEKPNTALSNMSVSTNLLLHPMPDRKNTDDLHKIRALVLIPLGHRWDDAACRVGDHESEVILQLPSAQLQPPAPPFAEELGLKASLPVSSHAIKGGCAERGRTGYPPPSVAP